MTLLAKQWIETLQQYLHSDRVNLNQVNPVKESTSVGTNIIQTEALRPELINATVASNISQVAIRPTASNIAISQVNPHVNASVSSIAVKDQFKVGVLNRPLLNAIDPQQLQRSQLAIQAKPQWTVVARQVYRQIPPVPRLEQPVHVGGFLLFPDPIWDYVKLTVSEDLFLKRPQQDYLVIDRTKLHNFQNIQTIQNIQPGISKIQPRNFNAASMTASSSHQFIAVNAINQATVSQINTTALYQTHLLETLQTKQGLLRVRRAFFASTQPWMKEFRLVVRREQQQDKLETTGGTAYLTVSLYTQSEPDALNQYRSVWTDALENAGYGTHLWKFIPVNLRNLQASLDLPPGCSVETSTDVEDGTVTFVIQLSATVVQAWQQALESRQPHLITGTCYFQADYFSRDNDRLRRDRQQLSASLPTLLRDCTPDRVQLLDPTLAIMTTIEVRGNSMVDTVTLNWQPNTNTPPIQQVFDAEGGTLTGTITATHMNNVSIDWQALVKYKMAGWSAIRQTGKLSAFLLREIVKPGSSEWIQYFTLFSAFMIGQNQLAISAVELAPFEDIIVEATLTLSDPVLTVPLITTMTLGNTEMTQIPFPVLPNATNSRIGLAVTTKTQLLDRVLYTETIALNTQDSLINIKINGDGRISIQPDTAPISESSIDAEVFALLGSLV